MRHAVLPALCALLLVACADPTAPDALGQWGSNQAGLTLSPSGGFLTLQCGTGTLDSAWTLTEAGEFTATGVTFAGGGPEPIGGRPPRPSRFSGKVSGDTFTLTVVVIATSSTLGPYQMQRNGPAISQVCL